MKQLHQSVAEVVYIAISHRYDAQMWGTPTLYDPGFHCSGWAVAWEEAPDGWVHEVSKHVRIEGVFIEPVNHWCVGLYPEKG